MKRIMFAACALLAFFMTSCSTTGKIYRASDFGIVPGTGEDVTTKVAAVIETIKVERGGKPAVLRFESGEYDFYPTVENCANLREYYVSNHDQDNPKCVAVIIENMQKFTIDGGGAVFNMNGRMLPVAMIDSKDCTLKNFAIDTRAPQITQVEVLENDVENGYITYRVAPYANYKVIDGRLITYGRNWELTPQAGIAFDSKTKHLVYRTSDIGVGVHGVQEIEPRVIRAPWRDSRLLSGTIVAMRSYARPTPGIFLYGNENTLLENVTVHYAEGMGLLAQVCEDITLRGFSVALREGDGRYFTTQADATHFSACKGKIISTGGLYEGMMDDAINVHGTYLRVVERVDDNTVIGRYMHPQAYGFYWGGAGDSVQFVQSSTMELAGCNVVEEIKPYNKEIVDGCLTSLDLEWGFSLDGTRDFFIRFKQPVPADIANGNYGIENLEWTPEVVFSDNIIRNNRARGALFSTPKRTIVENNLFDHTSGTAILLCGDCNGWFETGACRDVVIRGNHFVNALTNMFQFTDGIISIYPEIPDLESQQKYFHGGNGKGVVVENNVFETFDAPIVYAKSLDGFLFRGNKVIQNNDFEQFHWNRHRFLFDRVINVSIEDNEFEGGFNPETDIKHRY